MILNTATLVESLSTEGLPGTNASTYLATLAVTKKKFYNRDTSWRCYKTFFCSMILNTATLVKSLSTEGLPGTNASTYLASLAVTKKNFFNRFTRWRCYKTFFLFDVVEYSHASREFVNGRLAGAKRNNLFGLFGSDGKKVL